MLPTQYMNNYDCAVEAALSVIGGKWKGIILYHLLETSLRFNDIMRLMPKITSRTLTRQLRELERDGIVQRTVYAEVPSRVDYRLTSLGMTLAPLIRLLSQWGDENIDTVLQLRRDAKKTVK